MTKRLADDLEEVSELIAGYVDIKDSTNGPAPNSAMQAQQIIGNVIAALRAQQDGVQELTGLIESNLRQIFPDLCYDDGRPDLWLDAAVTLTKAHREADQREKDTLNRRLLDASREIADWHSYKRGAERRIAELEATVFGWKDAFTIERGRAEKAEAALRGK